MADSENEPQAQTPQHRDAHATQSEPTGAAAPGPASSKGKNLLRTVARGLLAVVILGAGIYAALWFNWTEGQAQTGDPAEESARLVETVPAQRQTTRVTVRAMGNVMPAREVILRPRVSGKIVEQSEAFVPGGHFEAGELMVRLDPSDYRDAVQQRESELQQARATLQIERGDQAVAREELELLEADIPEINRDLILRKPQVSQAEASVTSAEAALNQAKANLRRTSIEAPFDGHLVSRSVTAGNNVSQGDQLATYVGSDRYWIELAVPVAHLRWIEVPDGPNERGSPARITNADTWGEAAFRRGRVTRLIGRLEAQSRLARVLVAVEDPLALSEAKADKPRLILDSFVDVRLQGRRLEDVAVIDRAYVRRGETVWVMNGSNRLEMRDVSVAFRGKQRAYIESGLEDGDRVVSTNLASPVSGMLLRTAEPADERMANQQQEAGDE